MQAGLLLGAAELGGCLNLGFQKLHLFARMLWSVLAVLELACSRGAIQGERWNYRIQI